MNTINRVFVVLLLVFLMLIMTTVFVVPQIILTNVGQWMHDWGIFFDNVQSPILRFALGLGLAAIFDLIFALLIFFEVRPRRKKFIRVQQVTGGMATINIDSIVNQLQHRIDPLPGVIKVNSKIKARGDKVQAIVDVDVGAGSSVPNMASQLVARVQTVLEDDLGLQVSGEPEVRIRMASEPAPQKSPVSRERTKAPVSKPPMEPEKKKREQAREKEARMKAEPEPKPKSEPKPELEGPTSPPPLPERDAPDWGGLNPEEEDTGRA